VRYLVMFFYSFGNCNLLLYIIPPIHVLLWNILRWHFASFISSAVVRLDCRVPLLWYKGVYSKKASLSDFFSFLGTKTHDSLFEFMYRSHLMWAIWGWFYFLGWGSCYRCGACVYEGVYVRGKRCNVFMWVSTSLIVSCGTAINCLVDVELFCF